MTQLHKLYDWMRNQGIIIHVEAEKSRPDEEFGYSLFHVRCAGPEAQANELVLWAITEFEKQLEGHKHVWWRAIPRLETFNDFSSSESQVKIYFRGCSW